MYYSIYLDDLAEELYTLPSDVRGGHYVGYEGTKDECIKQIMIGLKKLIESMIYESDDYGYKLDGDE